MRVLVACEFSGVVRDAFRRLGHEAVSCDLLPTEAEGPHIVGDAIEAAYGQPWDLMIAHPPCTHLAVSGAAYFHRKQQQQFDALGFVYMLLKAPIHRIALENPVGVISTRLREPDQIIHPWQFGHGDMKTTCLWLKNLPPLHHTAYREREFVTLADGSLYPKWSYDTFRLPAKGSRQGAVSHVLGNSRSNGRPVEHTSPVSSVLYHLAEGDRNTMKTVPKNDPRAIHRAACNALPLCGVPSGRISMSGVMLTCAACVEASKPLTREAAYAAFLESAKRAGVGGIA